jgi:DNA recombination protein RmuC
MEILLVILGIAIGFPLGWFVVQRSHRNAVGDLNVKLNSLAIEKARAEERILSLGEKLESQKKELDDLYARVTGEFERIAGQILLESSRTIQQQHREKLGEVLNPLKEKIESFERKVDDTHKETIRENQSLKEQLQTLQKLNQTIGEEAKNLTTALKGQAKTQGQWGEIILESILEKSGLAKGREYTVQETMYNAEGRRLQPDVVINLPDNKNLVVDSKLSLTAYERYCNADDEQLRASYLKDHLNSIRKHIRELSDKNYQSLYQLQSLDFVLMFIPIEPAFSLAVHADTALWNEAFERNIVIVTTSTLLATLRTIANIWRQENQNRNAIEIARQGGELYDKFVAFVDDLIEVGKRMDGAKRSYEEAMSKLYEGRGNLVRRAEEMKSLGAKATKAIPSQLMERAQGGEETLFDSHLHSIIERKD